MRCCKKATSSEIGLERCSLRFKNRKVEASYLRDVSGQLARNSCACATALVLLEAANLAALCWDEQCYSNNSHFALKMRCAKFDLGLGGLGLVTAICMWAQYRLRFLPHRAAEAVVVTVLMLMLPCAVLTQDWYAARLFGIEDPLAELEREAFADTWLLLAVDVLVTASHVALPVRWCVLWPFEVLGVALYPALALTLGSAEEMHWRVYAIAIGGLVCMAAAGHRMAETQRRLVFQDANLERALRSEVEFQLELKEVSASAASGSAREDNDKEPAEADPTKSTPFFEAGTLQERLEKLAQLGETEHWLLNPKDLQLDPTHILGRGGFGVVVEGAFHGAPVAVKCMLAPAEAGADKRLGDVANELRVMRHVRHPSIATFHGAVVDGGEIALVMEVVHGLQLQQYVQGKPTEAALYAVLLHLFRALEYLHGRTKPLGGTALWVAPEVIGRKRGLSVAADVWSLGLLVRFGAVHELPPRSKELPQWPSERATPFQGACREVCEPCFSQNPSERPSVRKMHEDFLTWPAYIVGLNNQQNPTLMKYSIGLETARRLSQLRARPGSASMGPVARQMRQWLATMSCSELLLETQPPAELVHAPFAPTPPHTRLAMLVGVLERWVSDAPVTCCGFHRALGELRTFTEQLADRPCQAELCGPVGEGTVQCPNCKALLDLDQGSAGGWPNECDVCLHNFAQA